jgi:4-alpha-glucanotransferase
VAGRESRSLRELAALHSVLTAYRDAAGKRQVASDEALLSILSAMGVEIDSPRGAASLLTARKKEIASRSIEPVTIAWNGRLSVDLNMRRKTGDTAEILMHLESGETQRARVKVVAARTKSEQGEGAATPRRSTHRIRFPQILPIGYHEAEISIGKAKYQTFVLSAPKKCFAKADADRSWGVFMPIYALVSQTNWGAGDFSDFSRLAELVQSRGGSVVATLPMLATFLGPGPYEPSPYSPASRLFWNEFYVDLNRIPEFQTSKETRRMVDASDFQTEIAELRNMRFVDYRRQMALKRRVLERLASTFFESGSSQRREEFEKFRKEYPNVDDYARFRATTEKQQSGWPVWPDRIRDGNLQQSDFDPQTLQYHLYAQWVTTEQLSQLADHARQSGRGLYLDFPLGVHPDGYDVWSERSSFATGASVGAPPDPFFTRGQDWGFPPIHPERLRQTRYRYIIEALRRHMRFAGVLRLDHVMALHRLYWIPRGEQATNGVYVRSPAEELYAVIGIESHRFETSIVGEDLGTVPSYVRTSMERHNLRRMYVLQYEARSDGRNALSPVFEGAFASINTHDMPTFAAWWAGQDIDSRVQMGLLTEQEAENASRTRERTREGIINFLQRKGLLRGSGDNPAQVHDACMAYLSQSPAEIALVSLEDLWLERQPQNTPGTSDEKPNWRRKAVKTLEEICSSPSITLRLKTIDLNRNRKKNG